MNFLPIVVAAVLGAWAQPPITEAGISVGPHWAEAHYSSSTRGQPGRSTLSACIGASDGRRHRVQPLGRPVRRRVRCCVQAERARVDLRGILRLGRRRLGPGPLHPTATSTPRYSPAQFSLETTGPTCMWCTRTQWGAPVACRPENITQGTERNCDASRRDFDLRLVTGAGITIQATRRLNLMASYRYSLDPREIPMEEDGDADRRHRLPPRLQTLIGQDAAVLESSGLPRPGAAVRRWTGSPGSFSENEIGWPCCHPSRFLPAWRHGIHCRSPQ